MRERFSHGYSYNKTFFRNLYDSYINWNIAGASSLNLLKLHAKTVGSTPNTKEVITTVQDPDTGEMTSNSSNIGDGSLIVASANMADMIHDKVNNDKPSCMTSFICTLVHTSGIMSQDDLDILIDHKVNYVRRTRRGMKQVSEYHRLGGIIEDKLQNDPSFYTIANKLYDTWLRDCVIAVRSNEPDEFERLYTEMVDWLCERYKVTRNKTW